MHGYRAHRKAARRRRGVWRFVLAVGLACIASVMAASSAAAAIEYRTDTFWAPGPLQPGKPAVVHLVVYNNGNTPTTGSPQLDFTLPPGVTFNGKAIGELVPFCTGAGSETFSCSILGGASMSPYQRRGMRFGLNVSPTATVGDQPYTVTISGAGASEPGIEAGTVPVGGEPYGFGFVPGSVIAGTFDAAGVEDNRAGAHPYRAIGSFDVVLEVKPNNEFAPEIVPDFISAEGGKPKDIITELPAGFVANPTATQRCTWAQFSSGGHGCPRESQIGVARLTWADDGNPAVVGVYNMVPLGDLPAQIAFNIQGYNLVANPVVQSDSDYSIRLKFKNLPEVLQPFRVNLEIWGDPSDPANDFQRCHRPNPAAEAVCNGYSQGGGGPNPGPEQNPNPFNGPRKPFISNPTNCASTPETRLHFSLWANAAPTEDFTDPRWDNISIPALDLVGCDQLPFEPTIDFEPTTRQADTPTGLNAHLHIPQDGLENPDGLATAHLKKTTVTLPEGVAFNAAAADGLEACTPAQIGLLTAPGQLPYRFNNVEPACPTASKLANATVTTPLLHNKLAGEVFLAAQDENPFDSTFAVYIVVREPSILVKLPGLVELNEATGQITTSFDQNPQLPFSDLELNFFDGPRASLVTPPTCGTFTSQSEFAPWSATDPENPTEAEIVKRSDEFAVSSAPNGGSCVASKSQLPFSLGFEAGMANPIAAAHSAFTMRLTRPDGAQEIDRLELRMPEGFSAVLRGVPYCSEAAIAAAVANGGRAEQAQPSCPAASQIGTTTVGAGAGSNPFYVPGKVYLAGPYKGTPLSLVVIVPAVAGPFDLGVQVVRSALRVNPRTAQITAVTDPLPRALEGVPLRLRDIRVAVDHPRFAINPTDCSAQQVQADVLSTDGASASLSNHFQVAGCERLGFKPRLSLRLKGGTKRGDHPALRAFLKARPGDSNLARAAVTLPPSAFLEQAHIRTVCTRVQFAADQCPAAAIYGFAKATSPLLDDPLQGPVYLRSSDNKLPDLVADLNGQVRIELVGRVDSVRARGGAGIRNTFEVVPDAPVDTFELRMQGGRKGLVVNSRNLCSSTQRATVRLGAQNGRRYNFRPKVVATKCRKTKRRSNKQRRTSGSRLG